MMHQKSIVEFTVPKPYFGIFAEYGTGKTLCALAYVDFHRFRKTVVVSTKTSVQSTWPVEINKHTDFNYVILVGSRKQKLNALYLGLQKSMLSEGRYHSSHRKTTVFLVNFDGIKNIFNELVQADMDCIIVDESTKIKSPKTERTQVLWKLSQSIDRRAVMTGFPITENLCDIYAQIKFLDQGETFGNSYYAFVNRYFSKIAFKVLPKSFANKEILKKIKPFCIRVSGSALKLPPKVYKEVAIELTATQKRLLDEFNDTFQLEFGKVKIDTQYIFSLINKSLQICDGFVTDEKKNTAAIPTNKDTALLEVLDEIDIKHNKVIIWAAFRFSVAKIEKILVRLGYRVLTLTGSTKNVDKVINTFQHKSQFNILIATQKKAAESITLTACNHAIYYSNNWSYDLRANSEARIYRKGSERHKHVVYTDLVTQDSVENNVLQCLKKKKNLINILKTEFGGL